MLRRLWDWIRARRNRSAINNAVFPALTVEVRLKAMRANGVVLAERTEHCVAVGGYLVRQGSEDYWEMPEPGVAYMRCEFFGTHVDLDLGADGDWNVRGIMLQPQLLRFTGNDETEDAWKGD